METYYSSIASFLLVFGLFASEVKSDVYSDLRNFSAQNGLTYVNFVVMDPSLKPELMKCIKAFEATQIRFRILDTSKTNLNLDFHSDALVLISNGQAEFIGSDLEIIQTFKIKKSILFLPLGIQDGLLEDTLDQMEGNSLFYIAYPTNNRTEYKQVITLTNNTIAAVSDLKFNQFGHVLENYNLKGMKILSNTLPWPPFFTIQNCDSEGKNCQTDGFLADYMDALGQILNFTWESHKPPDDNWGVQPLSGPFNLSGLWGGAMGSVVNGEYHISLSQWVWLEGRYGLMDFISTTSSFQALALTPQPPDVDTGLFIRPFRDDAWMGIMVVSAFIILATMVPYALVNHYDETDGCTMTVTTAWFFFVLINAWYSGAMTMFFSSEITLPFNTIQDVMRAYPDWKLKMMHGNQVNFVYQALNGDPLYAEFWDRVQNLPEETVYQNITEGLSIIKNQRAILHVQYGTFLGFFRENPTFNQNIKVFGKGRAEYSSLIVNRNSPLKPILQQGITQLIERGIEEQLLKQWEGTGVPVNNKIDTVVLGGGQVVLIYMIEAGTIFLALFILSCEIYHKKNYDGGKERKTSYGLFESKVRKKSKLAGQRSINGRKLSPIPPFFRT